MTERESWRNIGRRIRKLRKENRLTLKQLAAGCDLSANAISLVERGKVAPTVMTLCKISHALGVSASSLFQDICPSEIILIRATSAQKEEFAELVTDSLSGRTAEKAPPGDQDSECRLRSRMSQMVLCVSGSMDLEINRHCYSLNPGDRLSIYGDVHYHWSNPGEEAGIAVTVISPNSDLEA